MSTTAQAALPRRDIKVIGLVSTGHFFSHFYMLILPPLFPLLREAYGVGYTELGLAISAFSLTTGLCQAPAGFLVDRFGPRGLLVAGLALESVAFMLIGLFPSYAALIVLMLIAGIANSIFHPADYAILSATVSGNRVGRAFSVHTFAGHLGNAVAPLVILYLVAVSDWQSALVLCGAGGVVVTALLAMNSGILVDSLEAEHTKHSDDPPRGDGRTGLALLMSLPILIGVLFFMGISITQRGITQFGVSSITLLHDVPLTEAGIVLTAYVAVSPLGVLAGGWIADHIKRHDIYAATSFAMIAATAFAIAAFPMSIGQIAVLFAIAGFFGGSVAPSRDMLIRSVTPPSEMGKVFGFVSTGFSIGGVIAPAAFGALLDHGEPQTMFLCVGVISLLTIGTIFATGVQARRVSRTG